MRLEPNSDLLVEHLASQLLELAGDQSVRTIEALASALTNGQDGSPAGLPPYEPRNPDPGEPDPAHSLCRRVARRAVRRSLPDPTGGANAFHHTEASPYWSRKAVPSATFGSFLFYRL